MASIVGQCFDELAKGLATNRLSRRQWRSGVVAGTIVGFLGTLTVLRTSVVRQHATFDTQVKSVGHDGQRDQIIADLRVDERRV